MPGAMHGPSTTRTRRTWAVGHRSSGCSRCGCCVRCASTVRKEPVRGPVSHLRHADRPGPALPYRRAARRLRAPRWYASAASGSAAMPSPRALIGACLRSGVRVGPAWGPRRTEVTAGVQCIPVGPTRRAAPEGGGQQMYPRPPLARAAAHLRSEGERWGGLSPRRRRCEAGALARVKAASRKDAVCDRAGRRSDGRHQDADTALGCERRAARSLGWRSRSAAQGRVSAVHRSRRAYRSVASATGAV